jgi:excisionase family DNA binding protein
MEEKYLTVDELRQLFKVSRATVDRWRKEGLPFIKQGRLVRFDREKAEAWFNKRNKN